MEVKSGKIKNSKGKSIMLYILKIYILYAVLFGVIFLNVYKNDNSEYIKNHPVERFLGDSEGQDKVALLEDGYESCIARINFIENAEDSLDISYYAIKDGAVSDMFLGCILNAADRGVNIRLLLDGSFQNMKGKIEDTVYAISDRPNIEVKFYEPFSLLRPWTWNNKLHDKIIISDNNLAMIGGRNIDDRFYVREEDKYDGLMTKDSGLTP